MLVKLQSRPDDFDLRRLAAESLDAEGQLDDAVMVLSGFVNVTGHDDDAGLPCLCKRCLATAGHDAESGGMAFVRSFAVAGNRVLHFWMLKEQQGQRAEVRASVAASLAKRLKFVKESRR